MTTPERLRRRQRRETAGIAILAFGLVASTFYFKAQDNEQDECLSAFIQNQTDTSAIRSNLVERESRTTRRIIKGVFTATNGQQVRAAYDKYQKAVAQIDQARAENPVKQFPEDLCK